MVKLRNVDTRLMLQLAKRQIIAGDYRGVLEPVTIAPTS